MSNHLEKARNNWDAVLTVPTELRGVNGLPSLRFRKSTGTPDKRKACIIASQYVAGWKLLIEQAKGNDTGFLADAIQFRGDIEKAQDAEYRDTLESVLLDRVGDMEQSQGFTKAKQFYDVAMGVQTPSTFYFDSWLAQLRVGSRTVQQFTKDVKLFIERFPVIEDVDTVALNVWSDELSAKGATQDTQKRIFKGCRNYWKFFYRYKIKGMAKNPFSDVEFVGEVNKQTREPFKPHEIIELWTMARDKQDDVLADLIVLGAYTGARIEELCSLMVKDVHEDYFKVVASKTKAGIRDVPIHSHINPVIKRLKDSSKDGYLLPSLSLGKFGDRSNTMSSRFSKLKRKAGHGSGKVFHSLRHALISSLVNASVMEFHIADIVGHEKKGVTGKTYSEVIGVDLKRVAIEKVSYPFPELT